MVLVEKQKLEAVTRAHINVNAQPVPRVDIPPQTAQTPKVIIVDRETRRAKAELQELEAQAKDGNMTPRTWKKIQELKSQISAAEQEQKEAEQSSE